MSGIHKTGWCCVLALAILFTTASAQAANLMDCGLGAHRKWDHDPAFLVRGDSFPAGLAGDLDNAVERWNSVRGMYFEISNIVQGTGAGFDLSNDLNEISFQPFPVVGGRAVAIVKYFPLVFGCVVFEADVLFSDSTTWEAGPHNPRVDETTATNFRRAAVHEFGHVLGIDHQDLVMSMMMNRDAPFWGGGAALRAHPFPDDVFGARVIYPANNSITDVAISNFRLFGPDDTRPILPNVTQWLSPGQTFHTGFGIGNIGNEVATATVIVVLSEDTVIDFEDTVVSAVEVQLPPGIFSPFEFDPVVPQEMGVGHYSVGAIIVDSADQRSGNNRTRFPGSVAVGGFVAPQCGVDSDCPESGQVCVQNVCARELEPE